MKKLIRLLLVPILFLFVMHSPIFAQSYYHINRKAMGYSYSTASSGAIDENIHKLYVSSGKADLFFLYSDSKYSDSFKKSYKIGINMFAIDEKRLWYPTFSLFMYKDDENTGAGVGTSLPVKMYRGNNFDLIPALGAEIYFPHFKGNIYKTGITLIDIEINMGYYVNEHSVITISPVYKFMEYDSFFSIGAGVVYVIGGW